MTTIEQLIGDLLLRHNCVIVPSFGGFVARQVSARVDFSTGKMQPPSKSLLFNRQLINNDGLLITEFAQQNGISYETAFAQVRELVSGWNAQLQLGQRIELDRVGKLFLDSERNLCFEQDRYFNLLLESFGLGQVHFLSEEDVRIAEHTIRVEEAQAEVTVLRVLEPVAVSSEPEPVHREETVIRPLKPLVATQAQNGSRRKIWRYVAAACILPIAFYSVWIPMKTEVLESGILSVQDFNPFHTPVSSSYEKHEIALPDSQLDGQAGLEEQIAQLESDVQVYTYSFSDNLHIPVDLDRPGVSTPNETNAETIEKQVETPTQTYTHASMHYIVGCFSDERNATNLVEKMKSTGLHALVVDVKNGLHRVSAGGAASEEALAKIISQADAEGFSGWILK
jgi:hypothetical protein